MGVFGLLNLLLKLWEEQEGCVVTWPHPHGLQVFVLDVSTLT
jgi:hypothetical protein